MREMLLIGILACLTSSIAYAAKDDSYLIIPGKTVGFITADSTEYAITKRLKPSEYKRGLIEIGEGLARRGLILYPDTDEALAIVWKSDKEEIDNIDNKAISQAWNGLPEVGADKAIFRNPEFVKIDAPHSPWHTKEGIKVGATLEMLKRIEGKQFSFAGFGWDYGGRTSVSGVGIMLDFHHDDERQIIPDWLSGDRMVSSDYPGLEAFGIYVGTLWVEFD